MILTSSYPRVATKTKQQLTPLSNNQTTTNPQPASTNHIQSPESNSKKKNMLCLVNPLLTCWFYKLLLVRCLPSTINSPIVYFGRNSCIGSELNLIPNSPRTSVGLWPNAGPGASGYKSGIAWLCVGGCRLLRFVKSSREKTTEHVVRDIVLPETAQQPSCYMESAFMKRLGSWIN